MQSELKALKLPTEGETTARPDSRRKNRRSSSVDSITSVTSVTSDANSSLSRDRSPAAAGRPEKAAVQFIRESRHSTDADFNSANHPTIPGLKPVPSNIDVKRLKSARGLPEQTVKNALQGEFTDLCSLYEGDELSQNPGTFEFIQTNSGISIQQKLQKKRLNNYYSWLEAWLKYEKILVEYHGSELYLILADYKIRIMEFDKIYNWNSVFLFDKNHRKDLGGTSIDFCRLTHVNMTTHLNSNTLKSVANQNQITPKPYFHTPSAPFRGAPGNQAGRRQSSLNQKTEICINFNRHRCMLQPCGRLHICSGCGGDAPHSVCSQYGYCSKNQFKQPARN